MRLIDADRLLNPGFTDMWDEPIKFDMISRYAIESEPTIEAIPIEWLEKWFTEKHKKAIIWWDCAEGVFKAFMEDWRAENADKE